MSQITSIPTRFNLSKFSLGARLVDGEAVEPHLVLDRDYARSQILFDEDVCAYMRIAS